MCKNKPNLFYSRKNKCYAIRYKGMTEYFNHEGNRHDLKNSIAAYDLLMRNYTDSEK